MDRLERLVETLSPTFNRADAAIAAIIAVLQEVLAELAAVQ